MGTQAKWRYDEFRQVGKNYGAGSEVARYDESHARFRDVEEDGREAVRQLRLAPGETLLEIGCGTGEFALQAARLGARVIAVDVSLAMLERAKAKADVAGLEGIEFVHAGFLNYEHGGPSAAAAMSSYALHHLPDLWKAVALRRLARCLRRGGRFFLRDVVLEGPDRAERAIASFVEAQERRGGPEWGAFLRDDAEGHFREEYTTYDWILSGLLERAGFRVEEKAFQSGVIATYLCRRV